MLHGFLLLLVMHGGPGQPPRSLPQGQVVRTGLAKSQLGFQFLPSSKRYLERVQAATRSNVRDRESLPPQQPAPLSSRFEIAVCGTFSTAVLVVDGSGIHFHEASNPVRKRENAPLPSEPAR